MTAIALIKLTHKAILADCKNLKGYSARDVPHEMGVRSSYQQPLEETGKSHKRNLVPEQALNVRGKTVPPDGTFSDERRVPCTYSTEMRRRGQTAPVSPPPCLQELGTWFVLSLLRPKIVGKMSPVMPTGESS
jgi:hypothetical protein